MSNPLHDGEAGPTADESGQDVSYDFAIVTPKISHDYLLEIESKLLKAGFVTEIFESHALKGGQAVELLKLGVPSQRLFEFACASGAPARLEPNRLREACAKLVPPVNFDQAPAEAGGKSLFDLTHTGKYYPPFTHIYAELRKEKEDLYMPFVDHNRHKVMLRMLTASEKLPALDDGSLHPARGAGLSAREMDECHPFTDFELDEETKKGPRISTLMLLHEPLEDKTSLRRWLTDKWLTTWVPPWKVPVHKIRTYLGDGFGFYFLFLSVLTTHCLPIGLIGAALGGVVWAFPLDESLRRQLPSCIFAPLLVVAMAVMFADFRRKQATYAKEWGCYAWAAARPRVRPAFKGVPMTDVVYGTIVVDWPTRERAKRQIESWVVISTLLLTVVTLIGAIMTFKRLYGMDVFLFGAINGSHLASAMTVVEVQIFNLIYDKVARFLTARENWKTDSQYATSLTQKLIVFKLINTFASIIYIAFVESFFDNACLEGASGGCLHALAVQVAVLFISGSATSLAVQFILPMLQQWRIKKKTGGDYGSDDPWRIVARRQFVETTEYDNIEGVIDDYVEIAIQFGYLAGFSAAFSVSPLLCYALNTLQIKQDGYKLLWFHRRSIPLEVRSIGVWEDIFGGMLKLSVLTNVGIVVFTSSILGSWSVQGRISAFVFGCVALYATLAVIEVAYPPFSEAVSVQLQRQEAYTMRIIYDIVPDAVFDEAEAVADESDGTKKLVNAVHVDKAFI